jgi:hypothetical protein
MKWIDIDEQTKIKFGSFSGVNLAADCTVGRAGSNRDIIVDEYESELQALECLADGKVSHYISTGARAPDLAFSFATRSMDDRSSFLQDPATSYFFGKSIDTVKAFDFCNVKEKQTVVSRATEYAQNVSKAAAIADAARLIVEELSMNALYDAPGCPPGELPQNTQRSHVQLAISDDTLLLSCVDLYGSLDPWCALSKIIEVLSTGIGPSIGMNRKQGAGIGLTLAQSRCESFIMAVEPGQRTVVSCALALGKRGKSLEDQKRNYHILIQEEQV